MRKLKKVARFILELILTIFLVAFILINSVSSTIFNKSYVLASIEKTDYYDNIYKLINSNFENYIQQSGLDDSVLKDIVSKEKIEKDTKQILSNIYDGFNEKISIDEIKQNLINNINQSLNNRKLSAIEQKAIDDFIEEICNEYKNTILSFEFDKQINSNYRKIVKYIELARKITVVAIGVLIILLMFLNLKRIYKIAVNIGTSFLASGVIIAINIAYKAIFIATNKLSGKISAPSEPIKVPSDQPITGRVVIPNIYFKLTSFFSLIAIAYISSVIPKLIKNLFHLGIDSSIFCDKDILISEYLILMNNTVKNISK